MLVLTPSEGRYPDDADPGRTWVAPSALEPRRGEDGTPAIALAVGEDGGVLHLGLRAVARLEGEGERAAPLSGGRFRLLARTPMGAESGAWYAGGTEADAAVSRSVSLDAVESALAARAIERGEGVLEVEVELAVPGRRPAWPWIVDADTPRIRDPLRALLGSGPVAALDVEEAVVGLGREAFDWIPTVAAALPPPEEAALRRIADELRPLLFDAAEGEWTLRDHPPERLRVSLELPRAGTDTVGLRWSFTDFLAGVDDPGRHVARVSVPAPFEASHLHVVNDVPLHPEGISRVVVEARTGGPTGVVHTEFLPGGPTSGRIGFVRETHEPLELSWRTRSTFLVGGRPTTHQTEWRRGGLLAEIDVNTLGLAPIRIGADPEVFSEVARLDVRIGRGRVELDAERPERWITGRPPAPPRASVEVVLADGRRGDAIELPVPSTGLTIRPVDLGFGGTVEVELAAPEDLDRRAAYLAVQPEGGPWRTLGPGESISWPVRRATAAHEPVLGYRTLHVPRTEGGATERIVESGRRELRGARAVLEV